MSERAGVPSRTLPIAGLEDARPSAAQRVERLLGHFGIDRYPRPRKIEEGRWEMEVAVPGFAITRAAAPTSDDVLRAMVPELEASLSRYAGDARARASRLIEVAEDIERTLYGGRSHG